MSTPASTLHLWRDMLAAARTTQAARTPLERAHDLVGAIYGATNPHLGINSGRFAMLMLSAQATAMLAIDQDLSSEQAEELVRSGQTHPTSRQEASDLILGSLTGGLQLALIARTSLNHALNDYLNKASTKREESIRSFMDAQNKLGIFE